MQDNTVNTNENMNRLMSIKSASRAFNIGEKFLRKLVAENLIDHLCIGNRKLVTAEAIHQWYSRAKTPAVSRISKK